MSVTILAVWVGLRAPIAYSAASASINLNTIYSAHRKKDMISGSNYYPPLTDLEALQLIKLVYV